MLISILDYLRINKPDFKGVNIADFRRIISIDSSKWSQNEEFNFVKQYHRDILLNIIRKYKLNINIRYIKKDKNNNKLYLEKPMNLLKQYPTNSDKNFEYNDYNYKDYDNIDIVAFSQHFELLISDNFISHTGMAIKSQDLSKNNLESFNKELLNLQELQKQVKYKLQDSQLNQSSLIPSFTKYLMQISNK